MANQPTKYSKFLVGAASAALVATAVAPVASAADFKDTKGNTHEEAINALSAAGVISGYADGTFKPNKTLTRSDVVKMMGKWLVSEGYKVPTDYKTNVRFTDLKSTSNDELLQYAAVVKDNGVFIGSNDRLLAGDDISRENMAVVIVRAFDRVHDIDLASYVAGQDFKKDVTDLGKAKAEARPAIEVLDFFDITNPAAPAFNPKATTTRGQFASFLNKTLTADFSKVTGQVAEGVASVKAVNATTVEVTFKDAVSNLNSLNFKIDGLTVSNAAVKQTGDNKTVVLTTAVQKGGEKYTVTLNEKAIGSFVGASAVLPEKVSMITSSQQGVVGNQVIVRAEVTVAKDESKAGIPVTFNIVSSNKSINKDHVVEVKTNADGIAEYSYTQYAAGDDVVQAYATGKANVRATGMVYWANSNQLAIEEVTAGNDLANNSNKVFKVTALNKKNGYVLVAFKENIGVTPDKAVTDVKFQNALVYDINSNGNIVLAGNGVANSYPQELSTGSKRVALVKIDANGVGSFSLTGTNASVTPVVYEDSYTYTSGNVVDGILSATFDGLERQAVASTVKFSAVQSLALKVVAEGTQNAAAFATGVNPAVAKENVGGRTYTATLTGKDGKVAPEGSTAHVVFGSADYKGTVYVDGTLVATDTPIPVVVEGDKGEISFHVVGSKDGFATPTVFIDNGTTVGKLDKSDLQQVAETTYFTTATINAAKLTVTNKATGKAVKELEAGQTATFTYTSVDQNGFHYYTVGAPLYDVTFHLTSQFANLTVNNNLTNQTLAGANNSYTVQSNSKGVASIDVKSTVAQTVAATVTAANGILPLYSASVEFKAMASVLDRVNVATTAPAVLAALLDSPAYKAKLDTTTPTNQLAVATQILNKRPGAGYSQAQLNTVFAAEFVAYADTTAPTATVAYAAAVPAVLTDAYSTITITDTTKDLVLTATEYGSQFDGIKVVLLDNNNTNSTTTASLSQAAGKWVITVDLSDDGTGAGTGITATFADVVSVVNGLTSTTKVAASVAPADATTVITAPATVTLAGGSKATPAEKATIVATFNEAIVNPNDVVVTSPKSFGTLPVYSWNAAGTVLTIKLDNDAAATFTTGDAITITGAKDASGNTQVLAPTLP